MPVLASHHGWRAPTSSDWEGPRRLAAWLAAQCVANSQLHFRERTLLPALPPSACALLHSQAGPHAGTWVTAIPAEPATTLPPQAMQLALRRPSPGCGELVDTFGDHALACPRAGLLARRAKIVERAWVRVAREAVGADGQVVPQQWLCNTTAPGVAPRRQMPSRLGDLRSNAYGWRVVL